MKRIRMILLTMAISISAGICAVRYDSWDVLHTDRIALSKVASQMPRLDVPFVPTKGDVLTEMIRIANISKGDVVYDLGCGDGRIVIAAAEKSGATCVGIDIDPLRIKECRENVAKVGLANQISFHEQNLFDADISRATVVMLYLLPDMNLKLRSKLLKDLRPGARVVSHNYDMKQWQPDDTRQIGNHMVYFWVVPANVTGTWNWTIKMGSISRSHSMRLSQDFQNAEGWVTCNAEKMAVKNFRMDGNKISFSIVHSIKGESIPIRFSGQVNENTITGTIYYGYNAQMKKWSAQREPGSEQPLDGSTLVRLSSP